MNASSTCTSAHASRSTRSSAGVSSDQVMSTVHVHATDPVAIRVMVMIGCVVAPANVPFDGLIPEHKPSYCVGEKSHAGQISSGITFLLFDEAESILTL